MKTTIYFDILEARLIIEKYLLTQNITPLTDVWFSFGPPDTDEDAGFYAEIDLKLISMVDYVINGKCGLGLPSTVVDCTTKNIKILRQGVVDVK
jgi:hypothetical protein